MSDAPQQWKSAKGSITTEEIAGTTYRVFRLSVHSPQHGWKSQAVSVSIDRLEKHPHLYRTTLDLLTRDLGVWDPQ